MTATTPSRRHPARPRGNSGRPSPWAWAGLGRTSTLALLLVLSLICFSGLVMVDLTREHRIVARELQELRQQVYAREEEQGRLLLEISTFAAADRIERIAFEELRMRLPEPDSIVVVRGADAKLN